ncbi:MAG: Uma2 family endonuclease [Dehalococcoidia bacterium]
MPVSEETFERVALEDPDGKWELHCGRLRTKPGMTTRHNEVGIVLAFRLQQQLSFDSYLVSGDRGYVRFSATRTYVPDVMVVPRAYVERKKREEPDRLEVYREPLPLVVEVWSPSTGKEDLSEKLPGYQERGDAEIWLIHPRERTLRAFVRQADGSYTETIYRGGAVHPAVLPNISIDLDELFRL